MSASDDVVTAVWVLIIAGTVTLAWSSTSPAPDPVAVAVGFGMIGMAVALIVVDVLREIRRDRRHRG